MIDYNSVVCVRKLLVKYQKRIVYYVKVLYVYLVIEKIVKNVIYVKNKDVYSVLRRIVVENVP